MKDQNLKKSLSQFWLFFLFLNANSFRNKAEDRISESDLAAELTSVKDSDMAYLHAEY